MQLTKHWAATLDDYAIDLAWSPDGHLLAAASAAGPVALFAATDGARRHELPGHADGTNCLAWQPSSSTLLNVLIGLSSSLEALTFHLKKDIKLY
jgi:WD40 repeat protein